jgi:hypothetical protein
MTRRYITIKEVANTSAFAEMKNMWIGRAVARGEGGWSSMDLNELSRSTLTATWTQDSALRQVLASRVSGNKAYDACKDHQYYGVGR